MMIKTLGSLHFWLTFISDYLVFFPMHFMGLAGVPRRYYQFSLIPEFNIWVDVNVLITCAAILGGIAQLLFLYNFFYNIFRGQKAPQNPWHSNTLEWSAKIKHIHGNWEGEIPTVYRGPHEYSRPDRELDYFPQYEKGNGEPEHYHGPIGVEDTSYNGKKEKASTVFFSSFAYLFMKRA